MARAGTGYSHHSPLHPRRPHPGSLASRRAGQMPGTGSQQEAGLPPSVRLRVTWLSPKGATMPAPGPRGNSCCCAGWQMGLLGETQHPTYLLVSEEQLRFSHSRLQEGSKEEARRRARVATLRVQPGCFQPGPSSCLAVRWFAAVSSHGRLMSPLWGVPRCLLKARIPQ